MEIIMPYANNPIKTPKKDANSELTNKIFLIKESLSPNVFNITICFFLRVINKDIKNNEDTEAIKITM